MLNTTLYKSVHDLAEQLMDAAEKENREVFDALYVELKTICIENEDAEADHPVQWETLADFSEEVEEAITIYEKALEKAISINATDYMSSIRYSIASLQIELGQTDAAIKNLQDAKISSKKIEDNELKAEIHELLTSLLEA